MLLKPFIVRRMVSIIARKVTFIVNLCINVKHMMTSSYREIKWSWVIKYSSSLCKINRDNFEEGAFLKLQGSSLSLSSYLRSVKFGSVLWFTFYKIIHNIGENSSFLNRHVIGEVFVL